MEAPSGKGGHLCVLVHGLWGNPTHLQYVASALRARHDESALQILIVKRNAGTFTYDGIETGGERVTREIEDAIEEYARNGVQIKKISIVGYSLGGLVARYAIGLLFSKGYFEKIQPVNFCTFATPHLGVRTPLLGWHNHIWNVLGARTLSASGRQLFTIDNFRDTNRPLLSILTDKDSVFYKGLSLFPNKVLYANIVNDRSTTFYTSGISRFDPFADLSSVAVNYVPGYSPVVVDPNTPVSPSTKEVEKLPVTHRVAKTTTGAASRLTIVLTYCLVVPIGVIVFLLSSLIQTFSSRRRIRLHSSDESLNYHRLPLLVEEMQEAAEGIIEDIHHEMSPQHLPTGSEESVHLSPVSPISLTARGFPHDESDLEQQHATEDTAEKQQRQIEFPTLALTAHQFEMIASLDELGFKKFPVHIHKDRHSHAAIIVRKSWKRWDEGKVVVGHWLDVGFVV